MGSAVLPNGLGWPRGELTRPAGKRNIARDHHHQQFHCNDYLYDNCFLLVLHHFLLGNALAAFKVKYYDDDYYYYYYYLHIQHYYYYF